MPRAKGRVIVCGLFIPRGRRGGDPPYSSITVTGRHHFECGRPVTFEMVKEYVPIFSLLRKSPNREECLSHLQLTSVLSATIVLVPIMKVIGTLSVWSVYTVVAHGLGNWWILYGFVCMLCFGLINAASAHQALSSMSAFREAGRKMAAEAISVQKRREERRKKQDPAPPDEEWRLAIEQDRREKGIFRARQSSLRSGEDDINEPRGEQQDHNPRKSFSASAEVKQLHAKAVRKIAVEQPPRKGSMDSLASLATLGSIKDFHRRGSALMDQFFATDDTPEDQDLSAVWERSPSPDGAVVQAAAGDIKRTFLTTGDSLKRRMSSLASAIGLGPEEEGAAVTGVADHAVGQQDVETTGTASGRALAPTSPSLQATGEKIVDDPSSPEPREGIDGSPLPESNAVSPTSGGSPDKTAGASNAAQQFDVVVQGTLISHLANKTQPKVRRNAWWAKQIQYVGVLLVVIGIFQEGVDVLQTLVGDNASGLEMCLSLLIECVINRLMITMCLADLLIAGMCKMGLFNG